MVNRKSTRDLRYCDTTNHGPATEFTKGAMNCATTNRGPSVSGKEHRF